MVQVSLEFNPWAQMKANETGQEGGQVTRFSNQFHRKGWRGDAEEMRGVRRQKDVSRGGTRCFAESVTSQTKTWSTKYTFLILIQIEPIKKQTHSGQWWQQTCLRGDTVHTCKEKTPKCQCCWGTLGNLDTADFLRWDCPFGGLAVRQTHIHPTSCSKSPLQAGGFPL